MIERYNIKERVIHWIGAFTYIYLMLTGLAFYSPHMYWLAQALGGGPTSRFWHPIFGLAFTCTIGWMWLAWRKDMALTDADKAWQDAIKYYITHQDDKVPKAGKYNAGQKQFFWIMFFGGILLLLSGMVLWFTDTLPWSLRVLRYASVLAHAGGFLITLAGFIVHVYMGVFVIPGGLRAITSKEVPREWIETHHPLWLADKAVEKK